MCAGVLADTWWCDGSMPCITLLWLHSQRSKKVVSVLLLLLLQVWLEVV
jgi:hypothetical protein